MRIATSNVQKNYRLYFLVLITYLNVTGCQTNPAVGDPSEVVENVNYEKEKNAIMQVIENESKSFWNKDFDEFSRYWAHEEYVRTLGWWKTGGVTVVEGWKERKQRTKRHMENSPNANETATKVKRKNINIRISKDMAWMTFDQYGEDTGDQTMDMPGLSRETRILEKQDGQWKIVYVGWLLEGD